MMGLKSTSSSDYIVSSGTTVNSQNPITIGCWCYPLSSSSTPGFFLFGAAAGIPSLNHISLSGDVSSGGWYLGRTDGSTGDAFFSGPFTQNDWTFHLIRQNNLSSIWWDYLPPGVGRVSKHGTITVNPSAWDTRRICYGAGSLYIGNSVVAEFWYADVDIWGADTACSDDFIRQIAYRGPFSMPHIANNIVEYRSMRTAASTQDNGADVYVRGDFGPLTWTATGAPFLSHHPPLAPDYVRPYQTKRILTV